ncbi:hypothetical protein BaRGS_00011368 [Batillaria attramentaria]|uniref:Apple domain-containing protein n=1 Tax=Batillaria attramentaria TaxID=370345 RepID=A0ABD0LCN6_9CAEN
MEASCIQILLLFLPLSCMGVDVQRRENLFSKSGDEDVMYDDHLLFSLAVSSKRECALRCSDTEDCATFTFAKGSPSGTCRLHSEVMMSQCPFSLAPGTATYRKRQEPACEEGDLQQNFTKYAESSIAGHNIASNSSLTLEECQGMCSNNTACRTFEFERAGGNCTLQTVTPLDVVWDSAAGHAWDLYQRMCA